MTGPLLQPGQVDDLEEVPFFFLVPLSVKREVARGGFQGTHRVLTIPRLAAVLCLSWGVSELKVASPSSERPASWDSSPVVWTAAFPTRPFLLTAKRSGKLPSPLTLSSRPD